MKIFEAKKASKRKDGLLLLNKITFSISQSERIGIIGANGSGKSSLLKLVTGIYEPTSGAVQRSNIKISYVPEHFPENIRLKIYDYFLLIGKMNGKSTGEIIQRVQHYAQIFSITDFLQTPLRKCSKGTKQKVGIMQALLKTPDLLVLDEPLTGLDNRTQLELLNQLLSLPNEVSIIFTAHEQLLTDSVSKRIIVVENGRITLDQTDDKRVIQRIIKANIPSSDILSDFQNLNF